VVIPNGVDAAGFKPGDKGDRLTLKSELGIPSSARVLLLVGALLRKGIETALRALALLERSTYLVAVGAGPHDRVATLAGRLGVRERLRLIDPIQDVERYYRGADVLLFPTRYEPFGMVIAEAWASGLPVVTAATAGALEWAVTDEDVLVVAEPDDAEAFAKTISAVLNSPELATRLSTRGRALAERLSWDRVARETEEVYEQAVDA
jgi:glycosyltransferase involved in cell wall biosynthesis